MANSGAAVLLICSLLWLGFQLRGGRCGVRKPLLRIPRGVEGTGCYMVVLYPDASEEKLEDTMTAVSKLADGGKIFIQVHKVAKAFTVKLSPYSLEAVS